MSDIFDDLDDGDTLLFEQEMEDDISDEEFERRIAELAECKTLEDVLKHMSKYGTLKLIKEASDEEFNNEGPEPGDTIH